MNKYKKIGDRIKHLRGPDTQPEFAKKIGISVPALQNYEAGKRIPTAEIAVRIAAFRDVPLDFLLYAEPRKLTLEDARELTKYTLWLEGEKPDKETLEKLAHQYLKKVKGTKLALTATKVNVDYHDDLTRKILETLEGMNREQKRQTLHFIEGQKLVAERNKKLKEG